MISPKDLPIDVIINILRFDGGFNFRRGEIINKLDKNKYKDVIHFLVNKPLPIFTVHIIGLRAKWYDVSLSNEIYIQYVLNHDINNKIKGMEISLWKKYKFLSKVICE